MWLLLAAKWWKAGVGILVGIALTSACWKIDRSILLSRLAASSNEIEAQGLLVKAHETVEARKDQILAELTKAVMANEAAIAKRQADAEELKRRLRATAGERDGLALYNQVLVDSLSQSSGVTCEDKLRGLHGFLREVERGIPTP